MAMTTRPELELIKSLTGLLEQADANLSSHLELRADIRRGVDRAKKFLELTSSTNLKDDIALIKQQATESLKVGDLFVALDLCNQTVSLEPFEATHFANRR